MWPVQHPLRPWWYSLAWRGAIPWCAFNSCEALLSMRHLWFLGLCFTIACSGSVPTDGSVFVLLTYGSYTPVCLRIVASDGQGHEEHADIPKAQFHYTEKGQVRVTVYRKPDWGRDLSIEVTSWDTTKLVDNETRCSGNKLETLDTPERIRVPQRDFATFTATLQARDDDGDGYVLKTAEVAGKDCDDTSAGIHPGISETCDSREDLNCDEKIGCANDGCLGMGCDDGNLCTEQDRCVAAGEVEPQCQGSPKVCPSPTSTCFASESVCISATGQCVYKPPEKETKCDDTDACTQNDQCLGPGQCHGVELVPCSPNDACHLSKRLDCPVSAVCTELVDPDKIGQPCNITGKPGACRRDGSCSAFPFSPSNFDPDAIDERDRNMDVLISCVNSSNPVIFDSTNSSWSFPVGCTPSPTPAPQIISQGDESISVLSMRSLVIRPGSALRLKGNRPVILAVYGDATIDGALLADADGAIPGAGGNRLSCGTQSGGIGPYASGLGSGGGGGAFGQRGSTGGKAPATGNGGNAGTRISTVLVPLIGGCQGGAGGARSNTANGGVGGAGGGALQLAVAGALEVNHWIAVSGGGGKGGKGASGSGGSAGGGGGGGSGGGLLVEAAKLHLSSRARLIANGGAGAEGAETGDTKLGVDGKDGAQDSSEPAEGGDDGGLGAPGGDGGADGVRPTAGVNGVTNGAAGGGGGGAGVIVLRGFEQCDIDSSCADADNFGCDISPNVIPICL